jgi:type II secretory pathway component GspD/PulD (secretin)
MEGVDKILALPKLFSALITIPNALRAQVLIEAVIAEITSSDINELGIQWLGGNDNGMGMINLFLFNAK